MTHPPARQERKLAGSGSRFVMIGAPLVVIGIVLALLLDHNSVGIGVAIAVLGAIPTVVGLVLMASAGVERRERKDQPGPRRSTRAAGFAACLHWLEIASRISSAHRVALHPARVRARAQHAVRRPRDR